MAQRIAVLIGGLDQRSAPPGGMKRIFIVEAEMARARQPGTNWYGTWTASVCEVKRKYTVMFAPEDGKMRISVIPAG